MRTLRTSTTSVLYNRRCLALLSFVWFALFAASVAVVVFSPSVFSFVFPYAVCVFFLFFLLFMSSGEGGRDAIPFRCCRWYSFVPLYRVFSLLSTFTLTTSAAPALLKVYDYCKGK